ncbi:MAG: restriction endonuclease subunit S [Parcubacteria group bacterium]|jgi:restriction endonuclease S subunit
MVKLGDICDIYIGGTPSRKIGKYWGGKNLWVKIKDMKKNASSIMDTEEKITDEGINKSSVKLLKKGTLLFSFKLTIGKVVIAGRDLYTNEAIAGIVPKDGKVLMKYLYYILPRLDYLSYCQRATKGMTLNKEILNSLSIPLPSVAEQEKIIKKLDEIELRKYKYLENLKNATAEQDREILNIL